MADFVIDPSPSYPWTATIYAPGTNKNEKRKIDLRFRRLKQSEVDKLRDDIELHAAYETWQERQRQRPPEDKEPEYAGERGMSLKELVLYVVTGWMSVKTSEGQAVEFSEENLTLLLENYVGAAKDIANDFFESYRTGRKGN